MSIVQKVFESLSWMMLGASFALLWAGGLLALLRSNLPGGTGTSTVVLYAALLVSVFALYCMIKLLFSPNRGSHG